MDIDAPEQFWTWLDRVEADADSGDRRARLAHVKVALGALRALPEAPQREDETAVLKWVRQSGR